ncbi:MAG: c-type cytochrome biogenesis protein CcmI, partial [Proteobacteria bacterium]|nr:c-type cytochrome biogenesis protein CcmI [Pseudomonadota bacterium]
PGPSAADVEAARTMSPDQQAAFIRSMVERLAERLETEPGDFQGWLRLARAYSVLDEPTKAETALTHAAALVRDLPKDAPERAQLDEALRALLPSP